MVRQLFGLAVAGAVLFGMSNANAQFAVSVGNPYTGQSFAISGGPTPFGYGVTTYSGGYPVYAAPSVYVSTPVHHLFEWLLNSAGCFRAASGDDLHDSAAPSCTADHDHDLFDEFHTPGGSAAHDDDLRSGADHDVLPDDIPYYTPTVQVRTYAASSGLLRVPAGHRATALRGVFGGVEIYPY